MSLLSYKIREGALPQEKPRVYFCAHERDHTRFFESLSDEILALQNCSIWYLNDSVSQIAEDGLFDQLTEMQLFVIPVTADFLYTDNDARLRDMAFAKEQHIPILPIMMEAGLAEDFNLLCGNYQFLDKTTNDATAIRYKDKMAVFLSSVLVGDEEATEVRNAFAGYIFLSYRKKDRAYAQKVMRMIHENEQYRDVAIWYDEYLVPGEDFNEAIQQALDKSCLFVLTVTPNLVNEPNYVQRCEYPGAIKSGKPILPIEAVKTDRDLLEAQYPSLPLCIDCENTRGFNGVLLKTMRSLALSRKDTPEQRYYMGLAYLAGIDVERNVERGVQLICRAAQAGHIRAIRKMVNIYEIGDGVQADWQVSLGWREELVKRLKRDFDNLPTEQNSARYLSELMDLSKMCTSCGQAEKSAHYLSMLIEHAKKAKKYYASHDATRDLLLAQMEFGNSLIGLRRLDEAEELLFFAGHILEELLSDDEEELNYFDYLTELYLWQTQARVYEAKGLFLVSADHYQQALSKARLYYEQTAWGIFAVQIGEIAIFYGRMLEDYGEVQEAVAVMRDGIRALESYKNDLEISCIRHHLTVLYIQLSYCDILSVQERQDCLIRAKETAEELYKADPLPSYRRILARTHLMLGMHLNTINPVEARWHVQQSRRHCEALIALCRSIEFCEAYASQCVTEVTQFADDEEYDDILGRVTEAIDLLIPFSNEQLMHLGGNILMQLCSIHSELLLQDGHPNDALVVMKQAQDLAEDYPTDTNQQCFDRACYFFQLATIYYAADNTKAAVHYADKVQASYALLKTAKNEDDEEVLARTNNLLAVIAQDMADHEKAERHFRLYAQYCEKKQASCSTAETLAELGYAWGGCGVALYHQNRFEEAYALFIKAHKCLQSAYRQCPDANLADDMALVQEYLEDCESLL